MKLLWQQIPNTIITEIFCNSKYDGIVIDTEHSPFNIEKIFSCIQVANLKNKMCFVRLPYLDKSIAKICLDANCDGLIFSTVEEEEYAKKIYEFCNYPISGGNRGQGLVRENNWGKEKLKSRKPIIIPQIETKKAVDNLDNILEYNFDYYLIGPYDLSASLMCVEEFKNKKFVEYINKIKQKIPNEKLGIHIPKNINENIQLYENFGFKCFGMDTTMLVESIKKMDF